MLYNILISRDPSIEFKNSEDFLLLLEKLSKDVISANVHFTLFRKLYNLLSFEKKEVYFQSTTFWWATLVAHYYTSLHCLCRLFDPHKKTLSLYRWLLGIQKNPDLFDETQFRKRLTQNRHFNHSTRIFYRLDSKQLKEDIQACSEKDSRVKKLMLYRHTSLAHISPSSILKKKDIRIEDPFEICELQFLCDRALDIINRYSNIFHAQTYSVQMIGEDDYTYIIQAVEAYLADEAEDESG